MYESTPSSLTLREFARLPDDDTRLELSRGMLVREPPAGAEHGRLSAELCARLSVYVREHGLGIVFGAETGFVLRAEPPTVRAPDVAYVSAARAAAAAGPGYPRLAPDLAVEVRSPANTAAELDAKVEDYLAAGTRLVWIVEPRTRSVLEYRSGHAMRRVTDRLEAGDVIPGFRLRVCDLFR